MYLIQKCEDNLFETLEKNKDSYVMKGQPLDMQMYPTNQMHSDT